MLMRHKKTGGIYRVQMLVIEEATLQPLVIYSETATGTLWSRPASEFFDGRFETYIPELGHAEPEDGGYLQ